MHNPAAAIMNGYTGRKHEEVPAAHQQAEVFMEMGGKGDQLLFENDKGSRYEADEVPK